MMGCLPLFVALFLLVLSTQTSATNDDDLLSILVLYRHGDRTPVQLYKTDHYTEADFPEGLGQLTNKGKARLFELGGKLRERYRNYIENTLPQNVQAQSSPSLRCLVSSQLLLAGLFPPAQPWSNSTALATLWQPIAVETTEKPRAWLLNSEATCPAATHIEDTITEVPSVKSFLDEHREFIKQLEQYSGEDYSSWYDVGYLWDTLFTESEYFGNSFVRPKWLDQVGNDTWERLYRFNEMEIGVFGLSPKYQRLRAGPFLKEILANMNSIALKGTIKQENRQAFFYASHDTMISYILQALGFFHQSPSYSSGLLLELRRDSQKVPQVYLFYSNATNNFDIYPLRLNESRTFQHRCHSVHCSLTDFSASLQDFLPGDLEKECAHS